MPVFNYIYTVLDVFFNSTGVSLLRPGKNIDIRIKNNNNSLIQFSTHCQYLGPAYAGILSLFCLFVCVLFRGKRGCCVWETCMYNSPYEHVQYNVSGP